MRWAFYKACRGRRAKPAVLAFRDQLASNLASLGEELQAGQVDWGEYFAFEVRDPKPRMIYAAPFRSHVAHHAILNVCGVHFERCQIYDSYACRKNKGLDGALRRAMKYGSRLKWYLQLDVRKYFDSVDQSTLLHSLERGFKDPVVLRLFETILQTYKVKPGKGLPIGNLTSQYFANHYLAAADHFLKEQLRQKSVVRYMDDIVIWGDSKEELLEVAAKVADFLAGKLQLDLKYARLNKMKQGLTFLGYRLFPHRLGLSRGTRDRFRSRSQKLLLAFEHGQISEEDVVARLEPMTDFVRRGGSFQFRARCFGSP